LFQLIHLLNDYYSRWAVLPLLSGGDDIGYPASPRRLPAPLFSPGIANHGLQWLWNNFNIYSPGDCGEEVLRSYPVSGLENIMKNFLIS
jgi:hypothetical protein